MKHANIIGSLPQQHHQPQCLVCKCLNPKVYGRFSNGVVCSRRCNELWEQFIQKEKKNASTLPKE